MRRIALFALLLAATSSIAQQAKRPMTFEDMMHMKRLGSTAVSADGKWLGYSVTIVNLEQNTKIMELWLQQIAGGEPIKVAVAQPGDSGLEFASDNKHILFLSSRDNTQQVWLADFDPATGASTNPRKLTRLSMGADNAKWAPDSKSIVFTSDVYPDCPAITTTDAKTGDECNKSRDQQKADSKVKAQIFTHLMYRHWNHITGDKRAHLFLLDVATGKLRDLVPNDPHDVPTDYPTSPLGCGCAFSPDSKELAFVNKDVPEEAISTNSDIFTLDLSNPNTKPVKVSTALGGDMNPAYSPDGKYLAWRSQARAGYESDRFRLILYDRAAKTTKELLPHFDNWVDEFIWSPDSFDIFFTSGVKGTENIYRADLSNWRTSYVELSLVAQRGEFSNLAIANVRSQAGGLSVFTRCVIATEMKVNQPPEVAAIPLLDYLPSHDEDPFAVKSSNTGGLHIRQVTHLNDALLAQLDLAMLESFWFEVGEENTQQSQSRRVPCRYRPVGGSSCSRTGVQGFLIKPPAFDPSKKYPVKFLIHGGPEGAWGDSWSYRWNAELFAANGYVVVMINPGGSTGYGQAFVDRVNGDWGGKPFSDLMTGLDYAEQHYPFIDKTRECALGASYGGYMANWVLGHTTRFKCIVSHDGMFDPESAYGTTEELWFNEWEFKGKPWDYYGKPDSENPYRKWAPSLSAKNFKTPTLVVHGQLDYRLDVSEGYQLFTTLQRLGVPSKMLYFPDEGHWVLKAQNSQLWWKTVNDWVDEWCKAGSRE